ncbi:MAG: lipopolysaccharide kinase InaA family protein [Planctomycetota bacterium]|jgi:tRNA A-37 threonylcarbamoyl transferase component Bud32
MTMREAKDRWRIEGASAAAREAADALLPEPADRAREGHVLHETRYRIVSRLDWPEVGAVVLKCHFGRRRREALLSLLRPSRALSEWKASRYLQAGGLPVPEPLAVAERRRWGMLDGSFFAARYLDDARPFRDAIETADATSARVLLERAGTLLRAMHDAAFDHRDLHADNVLVTVIEGGDPQLHLIDLHRAGIATRVGARARRRGLGKWFHSLAGMTSLDQDLVFLRAYAPERDPDALQALRLAAVGEADRLERVRRGSRAKRCLLESSVYTLDVGSGAGARRRDLSVERLDAALAAHDAALADDDARVAKRSPRSRVTRHGDLVVKESLAPGLGGGLKRLVLPRRLSAGYRNAHLLRYLRVDAAKPLAHVRRGARVFTLYEDLSELPRIDWRSRETYREGDRGAQTRLRDASADWAARLHRTGIYHGDLKGPNVLVREDADGLAFPLIDTDRVRFFDGPVDVGRRARNLAQLAASIPVIVTLTERLRWYRRYAAALGVATDEREMAHRVAVLLSAKTRVVDEPFDG